MHQHGKVADLSTGPLSLRFSSRQDLLRRVQDPSRSRSSASGAFAGAAAMLQLRLLEGYLALPCCAAYGPQHEALTKLCSRSLRSSAFTTGAPPATRAAIACARARILSPPQHAVYRAGNQPTSSPWGHAEPAELCELLIACCPYLLISGCTESLHRTPCSLHHQHH